MQYNGQKKKDKQRSTKHTHKTKNRVTLFHLCRKYWLYWRKKTTDLPYVSVKHHHIKWWLFQQRIVCN